VGRWRSIEGWKGATSTSASAAFFGETIICVVCVGMVREGFGNEIEEGYRAGRIDRGLRSHAGDDAKVVPRSPELCRSRPRSERHLPPPWQPPGTSESNLTDMYFAGRRSRDQLSFMPAGANSDLNHKALRCRRNNTRDSGHMISNCSAPGL